MKKKVIFIEPKGVNSNVFAVFMSIPLLGPVYLATIAKKAGYNTQVLNENILGRKIKSSEIKDADILCITCLTSTIERGRQIAKKYKQINPNGKTIIGGIHSSMLPNDVINDFDQVIIGEGENIILDLLSGKIKNKIVYGKPLENLDKVPFPDFKLVKKHYKIWTRPVMTSRGCPYNCNFCSVTEMFGRKYRFQSTDRVIKEILRDKLGLKIFFVDDHFAANPKRTEELLDAMIQHKFNKYWSTQVRTEITKNPKLISKMRKAGCTAVCVGFESINPESLKEMRKNQTLADIKRSIKVFHDNGIRVHGMFMFGSDADTKATFRKTSDFCKDSRLDYVQYTILTPLPGTELYHKLEKENRLLHKKWPYYDGMHVVFKPKNMLPNELQQSAIDCFSDFYSYTNAINESLNIVADFTITSVKKLYTKAYFPTIWPPLLKIIGKGIIRNWVKYNKNYLKFLSKLEQKTLYTT